MITVLPVFEWVKFIISYIINLVLMLKCDNS